MLLVVCNASVDPFFGWYPSSTAEGLGEHSSGSFCNYSLAVFRIV